MIVTVTPNPALDLTWHVDRIVPGGTHRADTGVARAGGKGLNVARVAHAQGAAVRALATAGGPTGAEFAAELAASGVPHELVAVQGATRRSIALVDAHLGDTTIVNERGVNPAPVEWEALKDAVRRALAEGGEPRRRAENSDAPSRAAAARSPRVRKPVLVLSGSLPPGAPDDLLPGLIRLGRDAGATVIADTSGPALLAAADAGATVLKPNAAELAEATGIADPIEGACELLHRGASLILLSRGADGMLAVTSEEIVRARLAEPLAGNPTGAGDAAVAACAVLLARGVKDPTALLRRATAWSAAAVRMPVAGEIHASWSELESALIVDSPSLTALRRPSAERTTR
ncbi:Putative sugar kinase [Microbacterium sp. 8M]|uniref:1-phosphofructokinase family hexose kinase n=1 Tax=Microbacterium sp. 8M TaxID=2653153 RepID=UPI0012EFDB2D|nr:PfkB family carbohydrate kinase [Microbacterium sp. 8M]VXB80049.1 Putative sugar kinase [Microbacterium sp. 8M]